MGTLYKGAQKLHQGESIYPSESTVDPFPGEGDFTPLGDLDGFHPEQCAHGGPIGSGLAILDSMQGSDSCKIDTSASIADWYEDELSKSCPCLEFMQPAEPAEGENSRVQMAHSSLYISSGSVLGESLPANSHSIVERPHFERPGSRPPIKRLPVEAVRVLRSWLYQHQSYPYPTEQERDGLERQTGLDKTQISNWFTNARRRKMPGPDITQDVNTVDHTFLSPLERWQHSPPESEPATTFDIIRAAESTPYVPFAGDTTQSSSFETWSSNASDSSLQFGALSMSSYEHSHSSGSELSNQASREPFQRSPTPIPQMRPRRHRRRLKCSTIRTGKGPALQKRAYQCTFCCDSFRSKYDWQRHENALHLSVDRWNCAPDGGIIKINETSTSCVFCLTPNPDIDHLETHDYIGCREKPPENRSFSRKDHLQQHLRLTHNVPFHSSMNKWRDSTARLLSRCGFCDTQLMTWQERTDHLAEHFKNNADMDQWLGDWGFEPHIEIRVENAMPPYLLGRERRSMDPWKAFETAQGSGLSSLDDTAPNALDRYDYVREIGRAHV